MSVIFTIKTPRIHSGTLKNSPGGKTGLGTLSAECWAAGVQGSLQWLISPEACLPVAFCLRSRQCRAAVALTGIYDKQKFSSSTLPPRPQLTPSPKLWQRVRSQGRSPAAMSLPSKDYSGGLSSSRARAEEGLCVCGIQLGAEEPGWKPTHSLWTVFH